MSIKQQLDQKLIEHKNYEKKGLSQRTKRPLNCGHSKATFLSCECCPPQKAAQLTKKKQVLMW